MRVLASASTSSRVSPGLDRFAALAALTMASGIAAAGDANASYISPAELRTLATADLAARLLPDALAGRAASHKVHEDRVAANEPVRVRGVRFDLDAWSVGSGLCRRDDVSVSLAPVAPPVLHDKPLEGTAGFAGLPRTDGIPPRPRINLALAEQCSNLPAQPYARLGPGVRFEEAVAILRWFEALRSTAATGGLGIPVSCGSELSASVADRCQTELVALLAQAPVERTFSIDVDGTAKDATVSILFTGDEQRPCSRLVLKRIGEAPYRVRIGLTHIPPF